jgi:hypothetical protein
VVSDGDDTLWSTEALYDAARQRVYELVRGHGLDPDRWEAVERLRDVENVAFQLALLCDLGQVDDATLRARLGGRYRRSVMPLAPLLVYGRRR